MLRRLVRNAGLAQAPRDPVRARGNILAFEIVSADIVAAMAR